VHDPEGSHYENPDGAKLNGLRMTFDLDCHASLAMTGSEGLKYDRGVKPNLLGDCA